jgi:hypothetical protein
VIPALRHAAIKRVLIGLPFRLRKRTFPGAPRTSGLWPKATSGLYSMTSSARVSIRGGTVRPIALAVLRLIANSYRVGACTGRSAGRGAPQEHANPPHPLSLLCAHRRGPYCRRSTNQRNELAPLHSITSSALANNAGGTVRPRARAVLRLMASSNLLGSRTGRSAGLVPFKMRPPYPPICLTTADKSVP